jgi:biotin operon repressor
MSNKTFIKYYDYGYGLVNNLVLSYIVGWGDKGTYSSNEYMGNELGCNYKTIQRSLKFLKDEGVIEIYNPKGKSRYIKSVLQPGQIVPPTRTHSPSTRTDSPTNQDKLSHNNNRNKISNNNRDNTSNNISEKSKITKQEYFELLCDFMKVGKLSQEEAETELKLIYEIEDEEVVF